MNSEGLGHTHTCIHLLQTPFPSRLLYNIEQTSLCCTVGPCWLYILNIAGCFPGGASGKEPASQCRRCKRLGFSYWVGRSPGRRHGNSLQYSRLDRGAWRATVHRVTQNKTWLMGLTTQGVLLLLFFSCSHMSDSLRPHGLQHTRLSSLSPTPGACSNSCTSTQWCHSTISSSVVPFFSCLQSFPVLRVFSYDAALRIRWPKYWSLSLSLSISPSNEYSGLISFRMDWLDLLAFQGTLKSLLQHHSSKASIH